MKEWLVRKDGKACPICRVAVSRDRLQRFAVDQQGANPKKTIVKATDGDGVPKSRRRIEYNIIDETVFENVQMMESHGSYGSKIQTLIQHLLYIELVDPGAKSIVFSAWRDSLQSEWIFLASLE